MATPNHALAHVFLPNFIKLKGPVTVMPAFERRDVGFFHSIWGQAHIEHQPYLSYQTRDGYRIGTINLPAPTEVGDAHMAAFVTKPGDPEFLRYFTLEHDFVLARNANRTVLCEREGKQHVKRGEGPAVVGNPEADAGAFVDSFMQLIAPTKVTKK